MFFSRPYFRSISNQGRTGLGAKLTYTGKLNFSDAKEEIKSDNSDDKKNNEYLNKVYFEALGNTLFYSLNYERTTIDKKFFDMNIRLGLSVMDRLYPHFGFNFNFGKKHKFEFGTDFYKENRFYVSLPVGYRFEKNRFLFRLVYTPIFTFGSYTISYHDGFEDYEYYSYFSNKPELMYHIFGVSFGLRF